MINIYHASNEIFKDSVWYGDHGFGLSMEEIIVKFQNGEYELAGRFDSNDLDLAYASSQNVSFEGWNKGQRSTSVGDIIENDEGIYIVANCGFDKIKIKAAA